VVARENIGCFGGVINQSQNLGDKINERRESRILS